MYLRYSEDDTPNVSSTEIVKYQKQTPTAKVAEMERPEQTKKKKEENKLVLLLMIGSALWLAEYLKDIEFFKDDMTLYAAFVAIVVFNLIIERLRK